MEAYNTKRLMNAKLSDLDRETREKSQYLLAKAQHQIEEQEDDIKHMNELMLYAKCVAIRDTQVLEKQFIKNARKEEELRLDSIMEYDRVQELDKLAEKELKRVMERRKGAAKIREQIAQRHQAAMLDQERKDVETRLILKVISDTAEREKAEKAQKIKTQRELMKDVIVANQTSTEHKRQEKLVEEEEDRKVLRYIIDKAKRENEKEAQNNAKKAEREKELARLRAAQEKASDKQAQQDALRARRAYEAYEREWRRKEKDQAEKHILMEADLRNERNKQQSARENAVAIEAHEMKLEFYKSLERQKQEEAKLAKAAQDRAAQNRLYAQQVQVIFYNAGTDP